MPHTLLIVEDEAPMLEILSDRSVRAGFRVLQAKNGEEGIAAALLHHPDCILLDIRMPVMDGITMLKKRRADAWGEHVPVVILTNVNESEKVDQVLRNKAYDYLVKSDWTADEIIARVKARLKKKTKKSIAR
jgi:two-component system alkaline phosphatase synthesis response regulator PhoP